MIMANLEKIVKDVLGYSNSDIMAVIERAVSRKYDVKKLKERLGEHLRESSKVSKLASKILEEAGDAHRSHGKSTSRKRPKFEEYPTELKTETNGELKKSKVEDDSKTQDSLKIKEVMAEAQKMIEERKKKLHLGTGTGGTVAPSTGFSKLQPNEASEFMQQELDKARRAAELKARIADRLPTALGKAKTDLLLIKPSPLILDPSGKAVDASGKEVSLAQRTPTLKANLRAEKREFFRKPDLSLEKERRTQDESQGTTYLDPRVSTKGAVRSRRQFKFHEKGEFESLANKQRAKAKLEKLQSEIASAAKKTGISSAVKLAMVAPKTTDAGEAEVPLLEWWDAVIVADGVNSYDQVVRSSRSTWDTSAPESGGGGGTGESVVQFDPSIITNLVEHPIQLRAPSEPTQPQYLKVFLTKPEMKKLRRQNRKEMLREKTEKIRLGLEPPPEPKVKISNLMRVLGNDAIQDPTKMEAHVREQMAKRLRKHEEANASRKLTKDQRSAKKAKKLQEDTSTGVHVALYRVTDLSHPSKKFKVEMNAKQLYMTGTIVLHKDVNVVLVEGGPKQQKKFKKLMLHRIKWGEEQTTSEQPRAEDSGRCSLIWEGLVKKRSFSDFRFKLCPLEKQAREHLEKHGVAQYWDMAYSGAILSQEDETA